MIDDSSNHAPKHDIISRDNPLDPNQSAKLTDWKKEPSIAQLKHDMEQAQGAHSAQIGKINVWNDLMACKGKARPTKVKGRSSVQPKLIRRQAEWRYSALTEPFLGTSKLFKVSPNTFEDTKSAKQNEILLNYQFRTKLNRVNLIDDFVRATVDEGTCVLRVGWKRKTVMVKEMAPVYEYFEFQSQEQVMAFQQGMEVKAINPREFDEKADPLIKEAINYYEETGQALVAVQNGEQEVEVEQVVFNHPTVSVENPENVIFDPSCGGDVEKAKFAVVAFETCKADLEAEKDRYSNLDKVNWTNGAPVSDAEFATKTPTDFQFQDAPRKKVVAHEYWGFYDIDGKGILTSIVATWIGNIMIRMEENPYPDKKLPFVIAKYLPVKREMYGEPDAELLEDNQAILGAVTRGMIDLLGRSANGQQGFAKGMLDPLNRRRYENGQDYEFNPTVSPQAGLIEHKYPELPQSALLMLNLQNQEAEALTGVKSFGGGISGEAYGDVAAGIRGVLDASSKREMAILRRLAKAISDVGYKIIKMNAAFLSEKEVVRVTNDEFADILREDLPGDFDLEVDISTAEIDDSKSKDLGFILQTVGPNAGTEVTLGLLAEIAELKRMPELAHKLRNYKPPEPTPEQLEMIKLDIEKKRAEVAKINSEAQLNLAKAEESRANKDSLDLNFVEQETGTKHARDLEKMKGQAKGNQDLQVTKALTTPKKEGEVAPDLAAAIGFNRVSDKLDDAPAQSSLERNQAAELDPQYSLGSGQFDPRLDPALNPAINL
jgi:hypothetical protein